MITEKDIINAELLYKDKEKTIPKFFIIKRDENNKKIIEEIKKDFYPYFYIEDEVEIPDKVREFLLSVENFYYSYKNKKLKKLIFKHLSKENFLWIRDNFNITYEDDILYRKRFLIDNDITFTKNQRVCYLDIETNFGINIINVEKEIICITFYDSFNKKYYVFAWREDLKEEVKVGDKDEIYYFSSEEKMLINFVNKFNELSPDVLTGWFVNGFDLPYIVRRLRKLNLNDYTQKLSPFYDIKIAENFLTYLTYSIVEDHDGNALSKDEIFSKIFGIEIVDLLKVYKKLTYDNKPDNYKLNTVAQHLEIGEKMKIKNIFAAWKEDINKLIEYNIHDVELWY